MSLSLLIVDDEPELRDLIELYLSLETVEIHHASDGLEALALLKSTPIDAMITDLEMPNLDGEILVQQARQAGFSGEIMIITASLSERIIRDLRPLGVNEFVCKARPGNFRDTLKRFVVLLKNNSPSTDFSKKVSGF